MATALAKQLRKPSGFLGKIVAKMMEFRNRHSYNEIIRRLAPLKGEHILEIGYGPGQGINQIAGSFPDCLISGIDFSDLMYAKASARNKKFIEKGIVQLAHGNVLTRDPGAEKFDKIFCVNVIYFWNDLDLAFAKIFNMLGDKGVFLVHMDHLDTIEKAKILSDFCKYPVEEVEIKLKKAGFSQVEYSFDKSYFIRAVKNNNQLK